jgi:hypothetical protein
MCEQNSTAIPNEMTKLTNEIAFKLMCQKPMTPMTLATANAHTVVTVDPVRQLPSRSDVITRMAVSASRRTSAVIETMCAYCP